MRLHPRTLKTQKAERDLHCQLDTFQREHGLTDVEMHRGLLAYMQRVSTYWLRDERHGNQDKKADEE